jgi:hypothetical protein
MNVRSLSFRLVTWYAGLLRLCVGSSPGQQLRSLGGSAPSAEPRRRIFSQGILAQRRVTGCGLELHGPRWLALRRGGGGVQRTHGSDTGQRNDLDNAIKYTPNGGRVLLKIAREDEQAILEVADDGIGIPLEALPHVFKRFFRVDGSRSREQGGAGLGLPIVESICAAHGAQLVVTSICGKGSRFRVKQALADNTLVHAHS